MIKEQPVSIFNHLFILLLLLFIIIIIIRMWLYIVLVGSVNPESVMFRFGTILVDLLTGKPIPPSHVSYCVQVFLARLLTSLVGWYVDINHSVSTLWV